MADDLPSLSYDPALLGRDLSNSLDLASSAGTTPDEESQLRQAARALGVPLDTARSNPQLAKQEAQRSALDPAGYAARFPSAAKYLADPQNALVSHDDVQPLSAVERAVRGHVDEALGVTGAPDDNPGSRVVNRYLPNYAADKAAEQEVLRTQGFRAASALARRNEERRQALAQTGTGAPDSVKSGAERLLGTLSQAAQNVGGSTLSGLKSTEAGLAGAAQAGSELLAPLLDPLVGTILPENPLRRVASGVADYQQQVRGGADRLMPKADNDLQAGIYSGIASLSQNLAALPLALAPGGQGAAMSLFTVPVAGNEYAKAREKGASVAPATGYAVNQAVIEYATEKLPLNALIGDVKSGAGFLKTLFKQFALEVPGEQIATVLQDMNEWATLHPERSFQDYLNDRPSAAAQTLIATLVGTGGSVTVLSGLRSAADRLERRAQAEQQRIEAGTAGGEHLQRILAAAASSLTRQRDPETFAQLVQDAADSSGTAPSEVFIDARKLVDVLAKAGIPQDQIAKAIPSAADQLAEAVATDGSLALPIGEVTAAFAGSPAEAELAQNLRTSAEGFSAAEASEAQQLLQQLGGQAPQAVADAQQRQAWQDSTSEVHSALVDELNRAGRFTKDVNGAYAELVANFYAAQAARVGSTPKALYDQFPLRVTNTAPGGAALSQGVLLDGARTREDGTDATVSGGNLRLLHGSPRADMVWDNVEIVRAAGQKQGKKGRVYGGFYATSLQDEAQARGYASMAEGTPTVYELQVKEGTKVLRKEGDVTRLSEAYIAQLVSQGYGLVVGKDPRGRTEYVVIDKGAVAHFAPYPPTEGWQDPQNTYLLEADTPPPAPGMIRLYRGEHAQHDRDVFATSDVPDGKVGGWFSPDISEAEYYKSTQEQGRRSSEGKGRIVFIDVPETELQRYSIRGTDLAKDPIRTVENSYYFPTLRRQDVMEPLRYTPADVLFQTPGAARGTFSPAELNIALLERADLSTFLHETGHFFVEMTATLAGQPDAAQSLKDDAQAMLAFAGFTGTPQEWLALPVDQRREAHEKLAESFEQYLFEGKAPTPTLQPLFRRFRSWLVSVYRTIKDMLSVNQRAGLTDEVRAVFDRMIASEQAIDDALEAQQFDPLRALQDLATPEQWAAYQALSEEQKADALDSLQSRTLRDLRWFDNAKSRLLRDMQKEAQAKRKAIRDEVQAEVDQRPVYQAQEFLKRGRTIGENGDEVQIAETGAHKLNIAALEELFPKTELGVPVDWRKLGYGKYGMLSKDGLHPDLVAELFGFPSGRALVTALLNAEPRKSVVDGLTDIRMLERHGDLTSPEAMADAAREALANSARTRLVATEFAILTQAVGSVSLLARAARQTAEQLIAGKKLRALRPDLAAQAAARARRTADKAITTGDMPAAVEAKRSEVLQRAIERAEIAARKEHDKALAGFARIFKGTPEKVAKSRDVDTVNIARAVLARYGLGPNRGAANALAYVQLVEAYNGPLAADLQSILQGLPAPMDFRDMTLEQFRGLRDTVEGLYYMARRAKQIEIDGKKLDLDAVATEFVDDIKARSGGELPALPGFASTTTRADEFRVAAHSIKANLMRVEAWADVMGAPYKRYIWQPVADAVSVMRQHRKALIQRYRDLVKAIEPGLTFDKIEAPELGGFVFNAGKSELLHALLHAGNTSNLTKLLLGRGWGVLRSDGSLDSTRWDQFLTRMIDQGVLTKADFDFAQGVWDLLEEVKQDAQKAHKQLYGYYFSEVTATPLKTPFGEYRGGYVPAIADALSSPDAAQKREQEELLHAGNSFMFPTTGKGFTQSRVFYNRPLELDLRVIASHLDKVARFAYLEPTIKDVGRLLTNRRVARALNGYDQTLIGSMLNPWLQRTARQTVSMPGKNPKVDRFFSGLRSRAGLVIMFGNVVNTLQQVTGFSLAALKVPAPKLLRAVTTYLKDPAGSRQRAVSASAWMANRLDNQSYAMDQQIREILLDEGPIGRGSNWIKQHAYFLQSAVQNVMDTTIWTGAYDQAVEKGASHKEATRYADESVRLSQGSFAPEDISSFEVQTPFVRLFTQFYSYFNMWANLLGGEATKAVQALGWSKAAPRLFFVWFAGMAVPAVVAELIARGAPGDDDDEDGDGLLDEWLAMFFGAQARSVAAMVPGVGQVAQLLASNMDDKVYNDRLSISPALGMIEAATRGTATLLQGDLADGKNDKRDTRDALTLLGLLTGLPTGAVARAAGYGVDVAKGKAQPEGPADVVQGVITGR